MNGVLAVTNCCVAAAERRRTCLTRPSSIHRSPRSASFRRADLAWAEAGELELTLAPTEAAHEKRKDTDNFQYMVC
jgi:hypothetical protein